MEVDADADVEEKREDEATKSETRASPYTLEPDGAGGTSTPARAATVGSQSADMSGADDTIPAGVVPGHLAIIGTRVPPS